MKTLGIQSCTGTCVLSNADTREPLNIVLNRHSALLVYCLPKFQCNEILESGWSDS